MFIIKSLHLISVHFWTYLVFACVSIGLLRSLCVLRVDTVLQVFFLVFDT